MYTITAPGNHYSTLLFPIVDEGENQILSQIYLNLILVKNFRNFFLFRKKVGRWGGGGDGRQGPPSPARALILKSG